MKRATSWNSSVAALLVGIPAGLAAGWGHISSLRNIGFFSFKEEEINRTRIVYACILLLLQVCGGNALARSITAQQAQKAVSGWLRGDAPSVQAQIGRRAVKVRPFTDDAGEPMYYIVSLRPSGFVIVSADDEVEPIIGFADAGVYDPSPANPLGALVSADLKGRIATVRAGDHRRTATKRERASRAKDKWGRFIRLGGAGDEGFTLTDLTGTASVATIGTLCDIRVGPLLNTKWGQREVCDSPCYSYYTPGNYRCGCVATAMAQVMRCHRHPREPIGIQSFWIKKDGSAWYGAYTRGGDGIGGAYYWEKMTLTPSCCMTATERRAIGALCYDAAISLNTHFGSDSSQADTLDAKDSLIETFKYAHAVKGYNGGSNIGDGLIGMLNPNLDAKCPVIIGIRGSSGHAAVCDGYGYNGSTLYHHLNMGWNGLYNAWYNLPNIDSNPAYSSIYKCVYNIRPTSTTGSEVVSGRVYDPTGRPIANAMVYAQSPSQGYLLGAVSDDKGIYALDTLYSAMTYTIDVLGDEYTFGGKNVKTGTSRDNASVSGNVWGVDFYGQYASEALIGHWKLDETSGAKAEDSAGISDGVVYGGAIWQPSGGAFDGALSFGGNDYVRIPNESNFDMNGQITVASWISIDTVDKDWQAVITKGNSAWRLSTLSGEQRFHFAVTGPPDYKSVDGSLSVAAHEWHHVCGTYDGEKIRLYIDAAEDGAGPVAYSGPMTTNDFDVYIGENAEKPGRYWKGSIDDVRIYNYALSAAEIAKLLCRKPAASDANHDCLVDMADYAILTAAWLSSPGEPGWNPDCDISSPADNVVDMLDLNVFLGDWLRSDQ